MSGAPKGAAPAGNRGLTNATNKESTMGTPQHTRTSDGAMTVPPLIRSINAHSDGRDPAQVAREVCAVLHGATIEDILTMRGAA